MWGLNGRFKIRIKERADKKLSKLPAVSLEDVDPIPNRHFTQEDSTACLCSPIEEDEFLNPEFQFQKFLEQLVIPFLYGQVFYSAEIRWPWPDYQHGGIGLFQSYYKSESEATKASVLEFMSYLKQDKNWPLYRQVLTLTRPSKQACPCRSGNKFRDCHKEAIKGLTRLKNDISNLAVDLE